MTQGMLPHNGGELFYETHGTGEPVVFVHAFSLDHRMWRPQVEAFSDTRRTVTYDARGFGQSSVPTAPYDHADDLHALYNQLDIDRAHLVGLSMGGRIAINFALEHPDRVKSLTVMDSALDNLDDDVDWDVHPELGLDTAKRNWLNHDTFAAARNHPDVTTELEEMIKDYSGWHWVDGGIAETASRQARQRLQEIARPVLSVVGELDLDCFHRIADIYATEIPGARKAVVLGAGHMSNMESPDQVNGLLSNFFADADAA